MTGWLLTWLWQGLALVMVTGVGLRVARRLNAATRHAVWSAALGALAWLGWAGSPYGGFAGAAAASAAPEPLIPIPAPPDVYLSVLVGVWAAVALVKLLRLVPGLRLIYALRDRCRAFPSEVEARLPLWLEARAGGRRASLVVCDAAPGAVVLGFQHPYIAIPPSLLQALSADELDQVILHEHAHVQRRDDWLRLGESLLLAALWIHPAAAFIARALNREREMACDDWVVARTGLPKAYARCLAHAAEVRGRIRATPAMASALFGRSGDLARRVARLVAVQGRTRRHVAPVATAIAVGALVGASGQMSAVRMFGDAAAIVLPEIHVFRVFAPAAPPAAEVDLGTVGAIPIPFAARGQGRSASRMPEVSPGRSLTVPAAAAVPAIDPSPHEMRGPDDTVLLSSVAINGRYAAPASPAPVQDRQNMWTAAAKPGVEVAGAARKTGLGIAGAVTRAAVSLTRTF